MVSPSYNFLDADDADDANYNLPCGADLGADFADYTDYTDYNCHAGAKVTITLPLS